MKNVDGLGQGSGAVPAKQRQRADLVQVDVRLQEGAAHEPPADVKLRFAVTVDPVGDLDDHA